MLKCHVIGLHDFFWVSECKCIFTFIYIICLYFEVMKQKIVLIGKTNFSMNYRSLLIFVRIPSNQQCSCVNFLSSLFDTNNIISMSLWKMFVIQYLLTSNNWYVYIYCSVFTGKSTFLTVSERFMLPLWNVLLWNVAKRFATFWKHKTNV